MAVGTALADRSRIGGLWGPGATVARLHAMQAALGPGARVAILQPGMVLADMDQVYQETTLVHSFSATPDPSRLIGAYALAWVTAEGTLCLTADPIGHRSLYYRRLDEGGVAFASTIAGVLSVAPARLNRAMVPFFLTFSYVPGEQTLAEDVYVLPRGLILEHRPTGATYRTFWALPAEASAAQEEAPLQSKLRTALEAAVQRALPPPGAPLGATLSGGIDSSLVLALARRQHEGPMRCYSVSFGPEHANELVWSTQVARHCGVEQEVVEVKPNDILRHFDTTVATLSEPNGDPLTVPNTLLFAAAARFTDVVLNGEGGDPCFGGPKNAPMILSELYDSDHPMARERAYLRAHQKCYDDLGALLSPALAAIAARGDMERFVQGWFNDERWPSLLNKLMAINIAFKGSFHILPKVDHLSAPFGIQPRAPLFDQRVVELSFDIPAHLKRRGSVEKYLLKQAVADLLPAAVIDRPKSGMMVPVEAWFLGPLRDNAAARLERLKSWGLCQPQWLDALLDRKVGGLRPRRGVKLWLLLTLEAWLRAYRLTP